MKFHQLFCNGKENPLGIGTNVRLQWNYAPQSKRGEKQKAFRISVWDEKGIPVLQTETIETSDMQYNLSEKNGLRHGCFYDWQVTALTDTEEIVSEIQSFETGISDLDASMWIGCGVPKEEAPSAPIFRKSFFASKDILRARAYLSGLGLFSCKINGIGCNEGFLTPANTLYDYQNYFETLDISAFLKEGENIFSVQLGDGYNENYSQWGNRYFTPKGFRAAIVLTHADGTAERIDTDESWTWSNSNITANGLYLGEEYDANLFFDTSYPAVDESQYAPSGTLLPNEMPHLRIIETLSPVSEWETDGGTMYDFGKNIQGFCRMEIDAPKGCVTSLQHSELITPEGKPDLFTNRRARAKDIYTCAGGSEAYRPTFTYHGFRYVFVTHSMPVRHFRITACFLSADVGEKAFFQCSEPIINRIHALSTNSIRANLVSIPTDCPMRDERTPCQMDSQMYEDAAMYNFNMYAYYKKWLRDITVSRMERIEGNMDWNGDALMLTYRLYLFYGDTETAKDLYPTFKRTLEGWFEASENGIWTKGFGDWCLPNDNTWESFGGCKTAVNTSLLHAYTGIMAEFAALFGYPEDQERFLSMGKTIRENYIARFLHEDGTLGNGRQPEMLLPLYYGILTGEHAEKAKKALLETIRKDRFFDTGGFSLRTVLPVLADADALNLFLETVRFNHYPGFGYWVAMGATSLWEQWASKGSMHSHNHAMHSGIEAALFQTLCGIVPTSPMFRTFRIAPKFPDGLHQIHGKIETYSGEIELSAEKIGDTLVLSCVIPPNTKAELRLPEMPFANDCIFFDGERRIEAFQTKMLDSGRYTFRLIPKAYIEFQPYHKNSN